MSKKQSPSGIAWGKASSELQDKVKFVLQQAQNNRYSVSRIYAAYNAVFELSEAPQTCSSCLTSRVKKLRAWWGEQSPKTESVPTTGEFQTSNQGAAPVAEATTYDEVVEKYGIVFPQGEDADEAEVLNNFVNAGVGAKEGLEGGITANELAILKQRLDELDGASLEAFYAAHEAKLAELGVTVDSSDADILEALEVLKASEGVTAEELALYDTQIGILTERIAAPASISHTIEEGALKLVFTPNADDATKGVVAWEDGSKVKAGTYVSAEGVNIAVQVGSKASIK